MAKLWHCKTYSSQVPQEELIPGASVHARDRERWWRLIFDWFRCALFTAGEKSFLVSLSNCLIYLVVIVTSYFFTYEICQVIQHLTLYFCYFLLFTFILYWYLIFFPLFSIVSCISVISCLFIVFSVVFSLVFVVNYFQLFSCFLFSLFCHCILIFFGVFYCFLLFSAFFSFLSFPVVLVNFTCCFFCHLHMFYVVFLFSVF